MNEISCIRCGERAGYHRAVVDVYEEVVTGGLCVGCEAEEFGNTLGRKYVEAGDSCHFCERDGYVALPLWRPVPEERRGRIVNTVEYEIGPLTVHLCDEHADLSDHSIGSYTETRSVLR